MVTRSVEANSGSANSHRIEHIGIIELNDYLILDILVQMLFSGEEGEKQTKALSGGEQARLVFWVEW